LLLENKQEKGDFITWMSDFIEVLMVLIEQEG